MFDKKYRFLTEITKTTSKTIFVCNFENKNQKKYSKKSVFNKKLKSGK